MVARDAHRNFSWVGGVGGGGEEGQGGEEGIFTILVHSFDSRRLQIQHYNVPTSKDIIFCWLKFFLGVVLSMGQILM